MIKRFFATLVVLVAMASNVVAQKSVYIPWEWRNFNANDTLLYKESDPENKYTWSKTRSKESDNFIVFWDKYYGNTIPTNAAYAYQVDIDDLLAKAEIFYALNVGKLKFADLAVSKLSKNKILIVLNHSTGWICYGGGYDFEAAALWLSPSTCKPVGQSVAHEIGHSFQYMCYSDYGSETGFHSAIGMGACIWEQTAQWQSVMSYPELMFDQSINVYKNSHHYAFSHEWQRYQSYWFHYYLADKYGDDIIGRIWRHKVTKAWDFNQVYMDLMGYTAEDLFREYMDHAMKMVTWDLDAIREYGKNYIGVHTYNYVPLGGKKFQVAYSSCPEATGYNVIPLNVPNAGTTITTNFTALKAVSRLAEGDPATFLNGNSVYEASGKKAYNSNVHLAKRGFRLGYVALLKDGTRVYSTEDSVYCKGRTEKTEQVSFTVPENVDRLWLVVSPAPTDYIVHQWDDNYSNDVQWPYQVEFEETNLYGAADIQEGKEIGDVEFTYDVYMEPRNSYAATPVVLGGEELAALGTAFQMQAGEIANKMVSYSSSGPANGKVMFYAVDPAGNLVQSKSTANGYGHWFGATGNLTNWGASAYVFSEYSPNGHVFNIGQYENRCKNGSNYTIRQALRYKDANGNEAIAKFIFNVHITTTRSGVELTNIDLEETPNAIVGVEGDKLNAPVNVYSLDGRVVKKATNPSDALNGLDKGVYIYGGKKYLKR